MKMKFAGVLAFSAAMVFGLNGAVVAGDVERGESKARTCAGCHGTAGRSNVPSMFPSLAGRDAEELVELLKGYRSGEIDNAQMTPQARNLSDEDIKDLAAYYEAQEPK